METDNDPVLDIPMPKDTEKVQENALEGTLRDSNSKTGITQFCEYLLLIVLNFNKIVIQQCQ